MANFIYNKAMDHFMRGNINLTTPNTLYAILVSGTYAQNKTHDTVSQIAGYEAVANQRKVITVGTLTENDTDGTAYATCSGITWTNISSTNQITAMVIAHSGGVGDSNWRLIGCVDTGGFPINANGGDITVQFTNTQFIIASGLSS